MASQLNHNAAYLYAVEGITVWERLRVIRNFLEDRRLAYNLALLNKEKTEYEISQLTDSIEDSFKLREIELYKPQSEDGIKKCKDEIQFLEELEKQLIEKAEPLRVTGKTDDEMYEINFYNETIVRLVRKAHGEIISIGRISPETLENLFKCPPALEVLHTQGIIDYEQIVSLENQVKDIKKEIEYA